MKDLAWALASAASAGCATTVLAASLADAGPSAYRLPWQWR